MFKDRSLILYFSLFFIGALVLVYQASGFTGLGDSVNFLCLAYLASGFLAFSIRHVLENSLLVTVGYMIPLLLRNILKEHVPSSDFLTSALTSLGMTFLFGLLFVSLGYAVNFAFKKIRAALRGRTTFR